MPVTDKPMVASVLTAMGFVTGERIAALDAIAPERERTPGAPLEAVRGLDAERGATASSDGAPALEKGIEPKGMEIGLGL